MNVRTLVAPLLMLLTFALVPAAAQAATIAQPSGATQVRELGGTVVFSQFDRAEDAWRLMIRRPGAAPTPVPVGTSQAEFQADIGLDSGGNPQLIYRRSQGTGTSDLFVYSLSGPGGPERPVRNANDPSADDTTPTLWRGRIAWTRVYHAGSRERQDHVVYTKLLTTPRATPSTRLPGVPQRRCGDVEPTRCGATTQRAVEELELYGTNLAQTVNYACAGCAGIGQNELRVVDVARRSAEQIVRQPVGLSGQQLVGPSFFGRTLAWTKACLGDPSGCNGELRGAFRFDRTARTLAQATGTPIVVTGAADTGTTLYRASSCSPETGGDFNARCVLEEVAAPLFQRRDRR